MKNQPLPPYQLRIEVPDAKNPGDVFRDLPNVIREDFKAWRVKGASEKRAWIETDLTHLRINCRLGRQLVEDLFNRDRALQLQLATHHNVPPEKVCFITTPQEGRKASDALDVLSEHAPRLVELLPVVIGVQVQQEIAKRREAMIERLRALGLPAWFLEPQPEIESAIPLQRVWPHFIRMKADS